MEQPTIREVAKLAGVAVGTVSNVLNGSAAVRDSTREKVEIAMRQLGFRPDAIARSLNLRRGRGRTVKTAAGRPRLSTVGYVSVDYTARVDRFPASGERATSQGIKKSLGGPAANVAVMAAGLGGRYALNCELVTAIGTDPDSEWAVVELADRGVRTVAAHPYRGGRLSRCIVLVDAAGARTIVNEPLELDLDELTRYVDGPGAGREPHCLHIEGFQVPNVIGWLGDERTRHLVTSVHATGLPVEWHTAEGLGLLLEKFNLVFLNMESARGIVGHDGGPDAVLADLDRAFRRLAPTRRARLLVVTMGAEGALIDRLDAQPARIHVDPISVVDTTGAGDAFVGCFLAAWLNGEDPLTCGRMATRGGRLAVAQEGAQGARISLEMLAGGDPHPGGEPNVAPLLEA